MKVLNTIWEVWHGFWEFVFEWLYVVIAVIGFTAIILSAIT